MQRCPSVLSVCSAITAFSLAWGGAACAQSSGTDTDGLYLREQLTYDDNLFRLPTDPAALGEQELAVAAAEDYINRVTVGLDEDLEFSRQTLALNLRADDVRFHRNDDLDHVAGQGRLSWNWRAFGAWSGKLTAAYNRSLADFANVRFTSKDMLETFDYAGEARYRIGPRWAVFGGARHMQIEHSSALRRFDDFEAESGRFGVEYETPAEHRLAFEYRYTDARFPNLAALDLDSREYDERTVLGRLTYVATIRTRLHATFGYLTRRYTQSDAGEFSGNIWRAEIEWEPRTKFATTFAAWHEIEAYADSESDYFVSEGFSIEPSWSPVRPLTIALAVSWADQEYLGSNPLLAEDSNRADEVLSAQAKLVYSPIRNLELDLSYRSGARDSNRSRYEYDANAATASIRWRFL